jgi:hypothetical protein
MNDVSSGKGEPYEIESIRRVKAPPDTEGTDWHRYIIVQGSNTINGYRQGNLKEVTMEVEEIVAQLNQRRLGKRGRVNLVPTPKHRPQR